MIDNEWKLIKEYNKVKLICNGFYIMSVNQFGKIRRTQSIPWSFVNLKINFSDRCKVQIRDE